MLHVTKNISSWNSLTICWLHSEKKILNDHRHSWLTESFSFSWLIAQGFILVNKAVKGWFGKILLIIVWHSLRKSRQMTVACSVVFFDRNILVKILYMSHTFNQASLSNEQVDSSLSICFIELTKHFLFCQSVQHNHYWYHHRWVIFSFNRLYNDFAFYSNIKLCQSEFIKSHLIQRHDISIYVKCRASLWSKQIGIVCYGFLRVWDREWNGNPYQESLQWLWQMEVGCDR